MGAALTTSTASVEQNLINNTYISASNTCTADCNQTISGNTIVLTNSKAGNVTFTQLCTADASCYMSNAVDEAVSEYQKAASVSQSTPPMFPIGFQISTSNSSSKNDITNNITQMLNNICQADVHQTIQDNIIYATDSTLGNIGFVQQGNANATCVMENSARLQLQVQQIGDATAKSGSTISLIAIIIAVIIVVIIITIFSRMSKKNTTETPEQKQQKLDDANKKNGTGPYGNQRLGPNGRPTGTTSGSGSRTINGTRSTGTIAARR
jgi:hypothetical protein